MEINSFQLNRDKRTRTSMSLRPWIISAADLRPSDWNLKVQDEITFWFYTCIFRRILIWFISPPGSINLIPFDKIKENSWNAWWLYIETWFEEVISRDSHEILKVSPGALLSHSWNFINKVFLRWLKQSVFELNSNVSPIMVSEGFSSWCRLDQSNSVKNWNTNILRPKIVNCIFR